MSTYPNDNYFHFPRYQSKFSGEEIDGLLDKVKLDLVDSDLKKQVEGINTAIEKLVPKENINTGTFGPTSDNPAKLTDTEKAIAVQKNWVLA